MISETSIPIGIARGFRPDLHSLGNCGRNYRETLFYVGQNFGLDFILFCGEDIDLENKKVKGSVLRNGMPEEGVFAIPKIIENSYYLPMAIQDELRKDSYLVRPKITVSKRLVDKQLAEDGTYSDILIPTVQVKSFDDILKGVEQGRVIIKSVMGMEGKSVVAITKVNDNCYKLVQMQEHLEFTLRELREFYDEFVHGKKYILQPFVRSMTKIGEPFDIRISIRRGENGKFMYKHFARIGSPDGVISNWAGGGYTQQIDAFLLKNYGEEGQNIIMEQLNKIGEEFPNYFNNTFYPDLKLYDMGLDIGIMEVDGEFKLYMFELNLRDPGGSIYGLEEQIAQCHYFKYLHNQLLESPNIQFIWPIEPKYKPTVHDHYYNDFGIKKIGPLVHNNGLKRLKSARTLLPEINAGFDIIAKSKSPVHAVASGTVIDVSRAKNDRYIVIEHDLTYDGKKVYTKYMCLLAVSVQVGDKVLQGDVIGKSGRNPKARMPLLHFRVMVGANAPSFTVDPLKVLPLRNFARLKSELPEEDFSSSAICLYDSMQEKKWEFSVLAKTKVEVVDIPEGTVVELISKGKTRAKILYEDEELVCKPSDLHYNFQEGDK